MAGFDVSILLRLIDKLTTPSRKASQSYQAMAQNITRSSQQIRSASAAAASGVTAIGAAATRSNRQLSTVLGNIRRLNVETSRTARRGGVIGDSNMVRNFGGYIAFRNILNATEETAKAENKFRVLVDNVTAKQMKGIRSGLMDRMMKSGETYAELLDAAGDAAQIMGRADLVKDITVSASKLRNIDTAGKDVAFFAETLAAVIGPNGTLAELNKLANMLAMQQKLGAATAGGTISAYKEVAGLKTMTGFDAAEMLTTIGLIKNIAPALQDSQIGNMAKYGLRMFTLPIADTRKKLEKLFGLDPKDFETDGAFDIAKTHAMLYEIAQTAKGKDKLKSLFSGKNVLAGQYWQMLLGVSPEDFQKYLQKLHDSTGVLNAADQIRLDGIIGPLNKLRASLFRISLAFGELLTPAIIGFGNAVGAIAPVIGDLAKSFSESYPVLSGITGTWLALVGSLGLLGLFSGRAAVLAGFFARLPLSVVTGFAAGVAGAVTSITSMARAAFRARGILGGLLFTLRGLAGGFAIYLVWKGVEWFYENWDRIKALVKEPLKVDVIFPELPGWLQTIMGGTAQISRDLADIGTGTYDPSKNMSQKSVVGMAYDWFEALTRSIVGGDLDKWGPSFAGIGQYGVPEAMLQNPAVKSGTAADVKAAPQNITTNSNNTSTVNVGGVVVNVTQSNADPGAIGAAAASAVGAKVRGALSDAPHSFP